MVNRVKGPSISISSSSFMALVARVVSNTTMETPRIWRQQKEKWQISFLTSAPTMQAMHRPDPGSAYTELLHKWGTRLFR